MFYNLKKTKNNFNERTFLSSFVFWFLVIGLLIILELLVKYFVFLRMQSFFLVNNIGITPFRNYNFAFSLYLPSFLMYIIYSIGLGLIVFYLVKYFLQLRAYQRLAWILIFSGAVLNIGERIVLGYVRDYVYIFSGIFNLADFYIILGVILLIFIKPKN